MTASCRSSFLPLLHYPHGPSLRVANPHLVPTRWQFRLGAVLVNHEDGHRALDDGLRTGHPNLDEPVRSGHGARGLAEPAEARGHPHARIARLLGSDPQDVGDEVAGRGAAPAVHGRAPAPALA